MRNLLFSALAAVTAGVLATGCAGGGDNKSKVSEVEITKFPVREVMMTADKNYRAVADEDTVYLDQYVSLMWPEELGEANLDVLRDSLMLYCFGDTVSVTPDQAIERFVTDTGVFGGEGDEVAYDVVAVDSLPEGSGDLGCYFNNVMTSIADLNEEIVTYKVTSSAYTGGAHPMTAIRAFTYDLEHGRVLGFDDFFEPEVRDDVMTVIVSALARQYDVSVDNLARAGFFVSQLDTPGDPYICNNILYFHYNPYEIAPYSSGMIDVAVYPDEVEQYLRPEVKRLFDLGRE